jgi:hypothetical protein
LSGGDRAARGEDERPLRRELAVAARIQAGLERVYLIERVADVGDFVAPADEGERESLLVRHTASGHVEMRLQLPLFANAAGDPASLDALCQIIEGVSHFVYVAERARVDR